MRRSGFRAWKALGGLAAVALLGVGCGELPASGGKRPDDPPQSFLGTELRHEPAGFYQRFQYSPDRGYNGTIASIGSSIDPRTPKKLGTQNQSRVLDVTGRPAPSPNESQPGIGGSGRAGMGDPQGSNDIGWRARRGYEVGPTGEFGSYGEGQDR